MTSPFDAAAALRAMTSTAPAGGTSPVRDASFDAVRALVGAAMAKGADASIAAVGEAQALAEGLWAQVRATPAFALGTPKAACGKGCGWCCHQRVGATATEVLYIAQALLRRPEGEALIGRLDAWSGGRPCVFLVDNACAIYDIRPFKCRGLYHTDARWCMGTYAKLDAPLFGPAPSPEHQAPPKDVFDGAVFGLAHPLHMAGRDCPGVDFIPALKAVIHQPDAARAWWRGETVFPPEVRLHDWFPPVRGRGKPLKVKGRGR
ncbi:YkgJ family cysteine cluster protein [Paramagnetospirillum magneticum]|uniref:YkgJ family cysteine cluster protein n=1 Tax=Paramagnetospirillum magneticum TaxID=84159 RepID=UPI0002D3E62B|nr:zinc/iron-chelating domain-containing protein [Paramagnetospirillum magneticum]